MKYSRWHIHQRLGHWRIQSERRCGVDHHIGGHNTIAEVGKGIFVLASSASTGSSNLTIQGDGSLNASASQTGIWVQSNSNNAALCVENAEGHCII